MTGTSSLPEEASLNIIAPFRARWQERQSHGTRPGEDTVEPLLVGICGTDLEIVRGLYPRVPLPAVLGHEWVGRVVGKAGSVRGRSPGRLVVGYNRVPDAAGRIREIGFEAPGALASRITLPRTNLVAAPVGVSPEDLVLAEPTAVVAHAVARLPPPGRSTIVIGDGPIGLIAAVVLRDAGHSVTVVGRRDSRMAQIASLGIPVVAAPSAPCASLAHGGHIDTIIEASGSPDAVDLAIRLLSEHGLLVLVGSYLGKSISEFGAIGDRNLRVEGVNTGDGYLPAAVSYIARNVVTAAIVGVTMVGRSDAPEAIVALARGERNDMKLVVDLRA